MTSNGPRTRDQRPCDNCRKRKIRCLFGSDDAINCVLCISRSTECTYIQNPPPKKRRRSDSADKPLNHARSNQRNKPTNGMLPHHLQHIVPVLIWPQDDASILRDYSTLQGNTLLKETLGHQNRQSSLVMGHSADFDSAIVRSLQYNAKGEYFVSQGRRVLRRPNGSVYFMMRPDTQDEVDQEMSDLDEIESLVAPYGPELVNLYFRIMHPSFPILHKKVFLEKHGRSYRESTPTGLGAVYLMALNWWSYSATLSSKPKPDAKRLERTVLRMLFDVHRRPKISDLQGGLVLLQQHSVNSWTMTGHLVTMSQNLGINVNCSDWQVPDWERGVRKRVAWAIYMQDKWGALVHGRPSNIKDEDWDVPPLEVSDFPETSQDDDDEEGSAEIEKGRQAFMQMVELTRIVSQIIAEFFTLQAIRRQDCLSEALVRAKPIQLKLKEWYANLPPCLSVEDTKPRRLSSVGYLHLAYYTAEITIHRAILRSHAYPDSNTTLFFITRQAASTRFTYALEFVKRLKPEHFQSFWYFSSSISFAIIGIFAGVLAVTSLDEEERKSYMALLAEYRWVLRISSTGAGVTKYGVSILDANNEFLEQHVNTFSPEARLDAGGVMFSPDDLSTGSFRWKDAAFEMENIGYGHDVHDFNAYSEDAFFTF